MPELGRRQFRSAGQRPGHRAEDRPRTAARLGVNLSEVDNTLYDAFGQRQVSTIYNDMNQYHVVMEVDPSFWQNPETLKEIWVSTSGGALSGTQTTAAGVGSFTASTPLPRSACEQRRQLPPRASAASAPASDRQHRRERQQRATGEHSRHAAPCAATATVASRRRTWR